MHNGLHMSRHMRLRSAQLWLFKLCSVCPAAPVPTGVAQRAESGGVLPTGGSRRCQQHWTT